MTDIQQAILWWIKTHTEKYGYPPTMREICKAVHRNSPATIYYHIQKLVKSGHIEYVRGSPRTLRVLDTNSTIG